jgi:hypothetical protein
MLRKKPRVEATWSPSVIQTSLQLESKQFQAESNLNCQVYLVTSLSLTATEMKVNTESAAGGALREVSKRQRGKTN